MSYDTDELPPGWVRQFDPSQNHPFWVDTNATPARAIWVHPYEDAQFLNEHPDIRDKLAKRGDAKPTGTNEPPPPYDAPRRHSYAGSPVPGPSGAAVRPSTSQPGTPSDDTRDGRKRRGFFGKLKDKAIGTKEEREAARRQEALLMQQRAEQRQRRIEELRRQRMSMPVNPGYGSYGGSYGQPYGRPGFGQSGFGQPAYGPPMGNPYGRRRQGGFGGGGMGGMALPLVGGLAGGLLLGEMLDGDGFGGGDFDGGGDFGGGDF